MSVYATHVWIYWTNTVLVEGDTNCAETGFE